MILKPFSFSSALQGYYVGPDLAEGPLPAVFYFALSAKESLGTDPYNQVVVELSRFPVRIFSVDLPWHEGVYSPKEAMQSWALSIQREENFVMEFVEKIKDLIDVMEKKEILLSRKIGVAGLSRGGLIACHIAAKTPEVSAILGFAPVTGFKMVKSFSSIQDHTLSESLDAMHLIPDLLHCSVRFYIGNRDTMVSTQRCFDFASGLVEAHFEKGKRSPPVELMILPSIGYEGHGTTKEAFEEGGRWIVQKLGVSLHEK